MALDAVSLLVGGGVTLLVTSTVQIYVVPLAQVKTRRRDRWEKDLLAAIALLEEEIPRALTGLQSAGHGLRYAKLLEREPNGNLARLRNYQLEARKQKRDASTAVGELMSRLSILEGRIQSISPDAPEWRRVERAWFRLAVWSTEEDKTDDPHQVDDETFDRLFSAASDRRSELLKVFKDMAATMKPPPNRTIRRMWSKRTAALRQRRRKSSP
jgi:hypothetical protein